MQQYITPLPGRTPHLRTRSDVLIKDTPYYKLKTQLDQYQPGNWVITVSRWMPETGWVDQQYFMESEELARFKELFK